MSGRRGHMAGSIQTLRDENEKIIGYRPHITIPGVGRKSLPRVKDKKEAEKLLTEAKVALSLGHLTAGRNPTLNEYSENWLQTVKMSKKESTFHTYQLNIGRLLPVVGRLRLQALKAAQIQQAYNRLIDKGHSARTVRHSHTALHKALADAMRLGYVGRNESDLVILPALPHQEMNWYSPAELQQIFAASRDDRLGALWVVLGTAGLRLGEGLGLMWDDIDFDRATLTVNRTLYRSRGGKGLVFVAPKSKRSRRTIDLTPTACAALLAHQGRQADEKDRIRALWQERGLVFPSEVGTPLEQGRAHRHWTKATAKAGVPRYRIHDLRHSVATALLMAGTPINTVSEMLGHSSEAFTLSVYGHVAPQSKRIAADVLEGLLAAAS